MAHVPVIGDFTIKLENVKLEGVSLDQTSTGTCHSKRSRAGASKARYNKHIQAGQRPVNDQGLAWLQLPLFHLNFALPKRLPSTVPEQSCRQPSETARTTGINIC